MGILKFVLMNLIIGLLLRILLPIIGIGVLLLIIGVCYTNG